MRIGPLEYLGPRYVISTSSFFVFRVPTTRWAKYNRHGWCPMLMGFRWNCSGSGLGSGPYLVDRRRCCCRCESLSRHSHGGSLHNRGWTCLSKLGVKHTLQFEVMLHLGLNLFQLCDAVVLNTSFLLSLLPKFKDFLVLTGKWLSMICINDTLIGLNFSFIWTSWNLMCSCASCLRFSLCWIPIRLILCSLGIIASWALWLSMPSRTRSASTNSSVLATWDSFCMSFSLS